MDHLGSHFCSFPTFTIYVNPPSDGIEPVYWVERLTQDQLNTIGLLCGGEVGTAGRSSCFSLLGPMQHNELQPHPTPQMVAPTKKPKKFKRLQKWVLSQKAVLFSTPSPTWITKPFGTSWHRHVQDLKTKMLTQARCHAPDFVLQGCFYQCDSSYLL